VVLFEGNDYLGGHTDTHRVEVDGRMLEVDTGFIVHNPQHYPLLTRLFEELGVATQATTMGFSVQDAGSGLEYNATSLDALFCQRRNLASPRFLGMLSDLVRFYRNAPELLAGDGPGPALGDYLQAKGYGDAFRDQHLVPMASALWSSPAVDILRFPARYLVQFMANHHMLQLAGRPEWRVVRGGSRRYVEAMTARWDVQVRLGSPVRAIARDADGATVRCDAGSERFDQVVLACHSDQALALLAQPSSQERALLGAIRYQANRAVLHTDTRVLPQRRAAWAAWNYERAPQGRQESARVCLHYLINRLQPLPFVEPVIVSLNPLGGIAPEQVLGEYDYAHPVFDAAAIRAQRQLDSLQGQQRTWFAGAWAGYGFHEDGLKSGLAAAEGVRASLPGALAEAA